MPGIQTKFGMFQENEMLQPLLLPRITPKAGVSGRAALRET